MRYLFLLILWKVRRVVYIIIHNRLSDKTILNIEEKLLRQFFFCPERERKEKYKLYKRTDQLNTSETEDGERETKQSYQLENRINKIVC